MSVLCCRVPDFLTALELRRHPTLAERPLALLGPDERVWAASREARTSGVFTQMRARDAQMRCPDVVMRELDLPACESEQSAFLATLARSELPVESLTWGAAYVDLTVGTDSAQKAKVLCVEAGRQVVQQMGGALRPSMGWDTGKFTAQAAARRAAPGHLRLVDRDEEQRFLAPLAITLLPLPGLALQQLHWLGIRTLLQFAQLPAIAVWQRFGQAGKLAQQWARGRDTRPVQANTTSTPPPIEVEFDVPVSTHTEALESALRALRPTLTTLAEQMAGCRRLRMELCFVGSQQRTIDCTFVEPVGDGPRLRAVLSHRLSRESWPGELQSITVTALERADLVAHQLDLFGADRNSPSVFADVGGKLGGRYGAVFFQARVHNARHPIAERRVLFQSMSAVTSE
jgi:nucleotidyltransferase/DNA polymerase involved in DNA repair